MRVTSWMTRDLAVYPRLFEFHLVIQSTGQNSLCVFVCCAVCTWCVCHSCGVLSVCDVTPGGREKTQKKAQQRKNHQNKTTRKKESNIKSRGNKTNPKIQHPHNIHIQYNPSRSRFEAKLFARKMTKLGGLCQVLCDQV